MSLTRERAAEIAGGYSDQQIEQASYGVSGRPWELASRDEQLALAAVQERIKRVQAAEVQARIDAPIAAARAQARLHGAAPALAASIAS